MNRLFLVLWIGCNCWAQAVAPSVGRSADAFLTAPYEVPRATPTGPPVSVSQLQHKLSKQTLKAYQHAIKLSRAGEHEKAASELEVAVRQEPAFSPARNRLGVEYAYLERWADAQSAFRRTIEMDPNYWSAHYNLGLLLYTIGDLSEAEQSTRRALQLSGENPQAHLFLGELLLLRGGRRAEALAEIHFAARTIPEARRVLRNLGDR